MDEAVVKRIPPHSDEAERSVIGSMMMNRDALLAAVETLTKEDFYVQQYGELFEAMRRLQENNHPIDPVTIKEELVKMNVPESIADLPVIEGILADLPSSANAEYYVQLVQEKATLRRLIAAASKIEADCYRESEETGVILEEAEKNVFAVLQQRQRNDFMPIRSIVAEALAKIEKAALSGSNVTGLSTGFRDLDNMTSGFQNSNLILIAARPSMGKTAFALNICENIAFRQKLPVAFFSLEMSEPELMNRLLATEAVIDSRNLRIGKLREEEWAKLVKTGGEIANSKLIIDGTPNIGIRELRSKARRYKLEHDICAVFIDYLQLIQGSTRRGENRQQEVSDISRSLKSLARELNIPVIALSQLNRQVELREDHRPVLADLRESGAIEQDADVIMFIHRDKEVEGEEGNPGITEIIIGKQRNGPTGSISLVWLPEYTRFHSKEKKKNQPTAPAKREE